MGRVLILVLTTAFYASVNCGYVSDFGYDLLTKQIEELKRNFELAQLRIEHSEQQISTLQAQLETQNTNIEKLQREVSVLSEANVANEEECQNKKVEYDTPIEEIELSESIQKTHHKPLNKQAVTCQPQLESEDLDKAQSETALFPIDYEWVQWTSDTKIPDKAIFAGDKDEGMFVARVSHNGDTIVGKACRYYKQCYFPWGGKEIDYSQCEVLTGSEFSWVQYSGGALPDNAFSGGRNSNGDLLYIGRVHYYDGGLKRIEPASGAIDGRCKILTITFGGEEYKYDEFDVLVVNNTTAHQTSIIQQ